MNIQPTTNSGLSPAFGSTTQGSAKKKVNSDFDTFLKMLTAQMKNQDPLNPVDSADYAVQLATFSSVEQQVKTNDLLSALGQQMGASGLADIAGWVGMDARVTAPANFDGSVLKVFPQVDKNADKAILSVKDANGIEVSRSQVGLTSASIDWAGTANNGQPLPSGTYSFSVESYAEGKLLGTKQAQIYATVTEAKLVNGKLVVVVAGGAEVAASDVSAIRAAGS